MIGRLLKRRRRPTREGVFQVIYDRNLWGDPESVSGPGSSLTRTSAFSAELPPLFSELGVRTLLDAPCGDLNWLSALPLDLDEYIGVDIVSELIAHNQRVHNAASRSFRRLDLVVDPLPRADLILCRDGLVHLSSADVVSAMHNFKRSGSVYLLTTTFTSVASNRDIETGGWRPINLQQPPFSFPSPLRAIDERRFDADGRPTGKSLALWRLEQLEP